MKVQFTLILAIVLLSVSSPLLGQDTVEGADKEKKLVPDSLNCVLNVQIHNEKGSVNSGDTITFTNGSTGIMYSGVTNDMGRFSILIPNGATYTASYLDMNGDTTSTEIPLPGGQTFEMNWTLTFTLPVLYTLEDVFFSTGKSTLRPESYKELNELVEVMLFSKEMVIEIGGHTDDVGEEDANLKLSQARAETVRSYLIRKGVGELHVKAKGYGESRPIAYNTTPEGRQKNRRTEVKILGRGGN